MMYVSVQKFRAYPLRLLMALGTALAFMTTGPARAQSILSTRTGAIMNSRSIPCVEESGRFYITLGGTDYALKFVLRYPKESVHWSGVLVVGVHGETGSVVRYERNGQETGTHETQLDDMIGNPVLNSNHAYASFERGVGGRDDALLVLYGFTNAIQGRLLASNGRRPSQIYLAGWSTGGTLTRYAVEDAPTQIHGAVIVAGVGGNPAWVTGKPLVPTIEIVGTSDTAVAESIRAYRDRLRSGAYSSGADLFRLYEVEGARHVSVEDDDVPSFERGKTQERRDRYVGRVSYFAVVRAALDLLDRWVIRGVPPPPDQTVTPPGNIR